MAPFRGSLLRGQCGSACVSEHQCRCEASRLAAIACFASRLRLSNDTRSEEHTSELQSRSDLVCRLLLEKKKKTLYLPSCAVLVRAIIRRLKGAPFRICSTLSCNSCLLSLTPCIILSPTYRHAICRRTLS